MSAQSTLPPSDPASTDPPTPEEIAQFYKPVTDLESNLKFARDEFNLAEFPLSILVKETPKGLTKRVITSSEGGELIVTPSAEYGWPKSIDDDILLSLILIARRDNFAYKRVYFTRQDIIRILGLDDCGATRRRIEESIDIWSSLHLKSEGAWQTKEGSSEWITDSFHIIDRAWVRKPKLDPKRAAKGEPVCWIEWSDVFLANLRRYNCRKFEFDQYLKLETPIAKRMFRFFAKCFGAKRTVLDFDLHDLAFNHLALLRTPSYLSNTSKIKAVLNSGFAENERLGLLKPGQEYYIRVRHGVCKVRVEAGPLVFRDAKEEKPETLPLIDARKTSPTQAPPTKTPAKSGPVPGATGANLTIETTGTVAARSAPAPQAKPRTKPTPPPPSAPKKAANRPAERLSLAKTREDRSNPSAALLEDRGVSSQVAARLAAEHPAERIARQVEFYDFLAARNDPRIGKNGKGFLVSSVKDDYSAPPEWTAEREKAAKQVQKQDDLRRDIEESVRRQREQAHQQALGAYVLKLSDADKERLAQLGGLLSPEDWQQFQGAIPAMRNMWRSRLIDVCLAERLNELEKWGFPAFEPATP